MDFKAKKLFLIAIVAMMSGALLTGCRKEEMNEKTSDEKTSDEDSSVEDPYGNIVDWLDIQNENNVEFYIMRVNDNYLQVPGSCEKVYTDGGEYPELENGQIAKVTADVAIYNGGIAGYMGNYFIRDLKDSEIIDYDTFINECSPGELYADDMNYNCRIVTYQDNDDVYLIVLNGLYIEVYKNGETFMEYDQTEYSDILEPLRTVLVDNSCIDLSRLFFFN